MWIKPSMFRVQKRENAIRLIGCSLLAISSLLLRSPTPMYGQQHGLSSDSAVEKAPNATHVLGLEHVKRGAKGRLVIVDKTLRFDVGATTPEISIPLIQDVFTSQDNQQLVRGKKGTVAKLAMPYGSGRVLGLLADQKIDVLTLEYQDSNGGLHGVIFTLPKGQAPALKRKLVEHGAHASVALEAHAKP